MPLVIAFLAGSASSQLVAGLQYLTFGLLLILVVHGQCYGIGARLSGWLARRPLGGRPTVTVVEDGP